MMHSLDVHAMRDKRQSAAWLKLESALNRAASNATAPLLAHLPVRLLIVMNEVDHTCSKNRGSQQHHVCSGDHCVITERIVFIT